MTAIKERQDFGVQGWHWCSLLATLGHSTPFSFLMTAITMMRVLIAQFLNCAMYDLREPWNLRQWSLTSEIYGWLVSEFQTTYSELYNYILYTLYGGISAIEVDSKGNWGLFPWNMAISVGGSKCHKICFVFKCVTCSESCKIETLLKSESCFLCWWRLTVKYVTIITIK